MNMKLNTYNITMKGIRKAAGYTKTINNGRVQISYDRESGEVLYSWHYDANSWTQYRDASVIHVVTTRHPMTMQDIADAIRVRLHEIEACEEAIREYA